MELPRKAKRAIEPVDEWLQNEGYYRKHSPKDATCLFRAISEQVYHNQRNHGKVRQECIDFMRENRHTFEEKISIPFDNYLEQLANFTEWGGMNEILAMSLLYKRNVVIFHGQKLTKETAIDHGYQDSFFLCFTPPKQYETVYTQEYTANAGFCQYTKWRKPWNPTNRRIKDQITCDNSNDKNQVTNSKLVTKNVVGNTDSVENQNVKLPVENFVPYKDYNHNGPIENLKVSLENTHISVQTAEQTIDDKTNKNDSQDIPNKKQVSNFNHKTNVVNKQNHLRAEKNDIYYPPYLSTPYQPVFRFPDSESVPYDTSKNVDIKGNEIPSSDPATVRHFYNLGVKFYWSQNTWSNGTNGQSYENSFFLVNPPPDINMNTNMISGPSSNGENVSQVTNPQNINNGPRYNNRSSPPRYRDQENINGPRTNGQKMNNRNSDFRNNTSYQCPSNDVNRNRNDGKNIPSNEQSMQNGNNKDMQRNNKSNGMAPRFKRNYENGKNRNDHHNAQHQYNRQQNQQDYDPRNKKQIDSQMIPNRCDAGDPVQLQQQQQQLQHQQQQPPYMQQQQPPPMLQPQTPPPLNGAYSYPIPYNQMPYMPIAPYQAESEAFSGQYYSAPTGYVQMPYLPATEMPEPPMYPTLEGFPPQYPPVYSQYVYPPAVYPNQPPPPESCYPPFAGQPVFFPYPPPPQPMQPAGLTNPPTAQSAQ